MIPPGQGEKIRLTVAFCGELCIGCEWTSGVMPREDSCARTKLMQKASAYFFRRRMNMARNTVFQGAATALITPLTADGVDFEAFGLNDAPEMVYRST